MLRNATPYRTPGKNLPHRRARLSWRLQGRAALLALAVAAPAFGLWAVERSLASATTRLAPLPEWMLRHWWIVVAATLLTLIIRLRSDGHEQIGNRSWFVRSAYYGGSVLAQTALVCALAVGLVVADPDWLFGYVHVESVGSPDTLQSAHLYDTSMLGCSVAVYEGSALSLRVRKTMTLSVDCDDREGAHLLWSADGLAVIDGHGYPISTNGGLPSALARIFCTCC
jgi:hypothetical protein